VPSQHRDGLGWMQPRLSFRLLSRVDAWFNRVYGSRWNPLYHSGAITVALLGVLLVTGIYLLVFYRLGAPYESVARLNEQAWSGPLDTGLHRFASDAAWSRPRCMRFACTRSGGRGDRGRWRG
jgi:quinol-cytochrome oxidoreductase complex cytochrome b subunit